jgi:hypothetical protein
MVRTPTLTTVVMTTTVVAVCPAVAEEQKDDLN